MRKTMHQHMSESVQTKKKTLVERAERYLEEETKEELLSAYGIQQFNLPIQKKLNICIEYELDTDLSSEIYAHYKITCPEINMNSSINFDKENPELNGQRLMKYLQSYITRLPNVKI